MLGFDLTFSAPKSVSVVFALGGEEAARHVVAAHHDGVRGALRYVESHALSASRGSGEQREIVPTTGLVAASFTHGVNRNLDPHLHTHVVMANMVHGLDGRWSACDHRGLSAHRAAVSAVYESHLRARALCSSRPALVLEAPGLRAEVDGCFPARCWASSRPAPPMSGGTWPSRGRTPPGVPGWHGPPRGRRSAPVSTSASCRRSGQHRARSFGDPRVGDGRCPRPHPARGTGQTVSTSTVSGRRCRFAPDGAARRRDVVAAFATAAVDGAEEHGLERLARLWTPALSDRAQVGVAEDRRTLRSVVPGGHLLATLGPRPLDPVDHEIWRGAARAIDDYRGALGGGRGGRRPRC